MLEFVVLLGLMLVRLSVQESHPYGFYNNQYWHTPAEAASQVVDTRRQSLRRQLTDTLRGPGVAPAFLFSTAGVSWIGPSGCNLPIEPPKHIHTIESHTFVDRNSQFSH